jgi:hypothetical protein
MPHRRYPSENPHSIPWIIVSRLIGLVIFFIIVVVLWNVQSDNAIIASVISFLVAPVTIALIVIFSLLFLVGEVFLALNFPLNLPGPFLNALGSIFLISFLLQLLYLVDRIGDFVIFTLFKSLEPLLYVLVFFIVLIVQYVHLFSSWKDDQEKRAVLVAEPGDSSPNREPASGNSQKDVSWKEVEAEFRMLLHDFFHSLRDALKK